MTVWRIKLNSGRDEEDGGVVDWDEAKAHCRSAGVVGVGWGLSKLKHHSRLDRVLDAWGKRPEGLAGVNTIARLANDVADADLMWTRDSLGRYWLCQITGSWRYDKSPESVRLDLYNVRPARWLESPFRDYEVPGAVVRSFTGVGQTLRRIGDHPEAIRVTEMLWAKETDPHVLIEPMTAAQAMADILDPIDVEDVVLLYMQHQGWLLLASSRMHDTPMYEAALKQPGSGHMAVVSVKSGSSNPVPVVELAEASGPAQAFAYSTHELYTERPDKHGVIKIKTADLVGFMESHPELLPPRIARWLLPPA